MGTPGGHTRRYLITGLLTAIPLWVTWWVVSFLFRRLGDVSRPWLGLLARQLDDWVPSLASLLREGLFQSVLAAVLTLAALYLLGWLMSRVLGARLLAAFEALIARIPLVQQIYGGTKKLLVALGEPPPDARRVVLIDFPSPGLKAVGLVTNVLTDSDSGGRVAAVYVPTTPNPTSGYLELVPVERLTMTDWTLDEAMSFVVSGGAVGPTAVSMGKSGPAVPNRDGGTSPQANSQEA